MFRSALPKSLALPPDTRTVRVENKGSVDVTYDLGYAGSDRRARSRLFVPGWSNRHCARRWFNNVPHPIERKCRGDEASARCDDDCDSRGTGNARYFMSEESGYVTFTPASGTEFAFTGDFRHRVRLQTCRQIIITSCSPRRQVRPTIGLTGQDVNTGGAFPA